MDLSKCFPCTIKGFPCTIITGYAHITDKEVDDLWGKGVCMDDWDYILVLPAEVLTECRRHYRDWDTGEQRECTEYLVEDYALDRLLTGCCQNKWYQVEFRGQLCAIGVAYHA